MQKVKFFLPLILFVGLAILFLRGLQLDPTDMPSALIDKPLPVFSLPALKEGVTITQNDLMGEVMLLNVWATWCVSCRAEHAMLNKLSSQGVKIIGLNYKDDSLKATRWLTDLGNPYAVTISDSEGTLGLDLGVFGAPETYMIDAQGIIRFKHVGVIDDRVWQTIMAPVFHAL